MKEHRTRRIEKITMLTIVYMIENGSESEPPIRIQAEFVTPLSDKTTAKVGRESPKIHPMLTNNILYLVLNPKF